MPKSRTNYNPDDQQIRVVDDEKKQALFLSQFKYVVPSAGVFDSPYHCYMINAEWAKIVMGFVSWMSTVAVWDDATDDDHAGIQGILEFLSQDGICMGLFQLRQSTTDNCILEQSVDGGYNWTTAFDYSLCFNAGLTSESLNSSIDLQDTLIADYDTTVVSIAPDMVYDATADDDIRDIALCHAINQLVDMMCDAELEYRRQIALASEITSIMLAILAVIVTIATAGTATPFYLAVSSALAGGFGLLFGGLSEAILNDTDARALVACCMLNDLKGATITETTFEASLDSCGFTGGSNEAQLAGAIVQLLTQDEMYISFVDYMQRAYRKAELGLLDCGCLEPWTSVLDLTVSSYGFIFDTDDNTDDVGVWTSGVGLVAVPVILSSQSRRQLAGSFDFDTSDVTSLRLEGSFTEGTHPAWADTYVCVRGQYEVADVVISASTVSRSFNNYTVGVPTALDRSSSGYDTASDELALFVRSAIQANNGAGTITTITITGIGTKPSQLP